MPHRLNINADLAEGYGRYDIGADAELLTIVKSANVACGFHGGDPTIMRRTVERAAEAGVSIGAHPGFNDLWGFGRRQIEMKPAELEDLVAYQIGGLQAMAAYAGVQVTHVKAHGALNNMANVRADYAMAISRAVKMVDPGLIHLVMPGAELEKATLELGLPLGREAFVDRTYEEDWTLTPRSVAGSVIKDPEIAAARVATMAREGVIVSRQGTPLEIPFHSLCVHGDEPTSVAVARAAHAALRDEGVELVTLPEAVG